MKLYVGNISYQTQESDLTELFSKHGNVTSVRIIQDRDTGRSKGFGFVEFESQAQANAALVLNGTEFMGREIKVSLAKEDRSRSSGGGYKDSGYRDRDR